MLMILHKTVRQENIHATVHKAEQIFFHVFILTLLSSELINVLELTRIENSDRLALSILWGIYALGLIVYGLQKQQKLLRILAFSIFGITLIKLFLYDMSAMSTIAKTIVMIVLGILLLASSFLYNKFKASKNETSSEG
jgi:uncharacterized membrane protein